MLDGTPCLLVEGLFSLCTWPCVQVWCLRDRAATTLPSRDGLMYSYGGTTPTIAYGQYGIHVYIYIYI